MLITDYLDQLDIDKDTLYNNLVNAGISASEDETFTTLCPKVGELTSDLKDEFKPSINITGVNITDEPLSEYPDKLNEGLINVLNNGTDVIFNNYPNKETKEGSSQIFSDCVNAKMKIQEKGYLLQYGGTPSPSNEVPIYTVTGDNYIEISNVDTPSQRVDYFLHLGVENLYNANKLIPGYLPNSGAYPTTSESWPNSKYLTFPLKAGHTLYIKNVNDVNNVASLKCIDKTTNEVVTYIDTQENNYFTSSRNFSSGFEGDGTVTAKVDFIVGLNIKDPSLTFSVDMVINNQYISENPIELCSIPNTDYQDTFIRTTGKNLLNLENGTYSSSGVTAVVDNGVTIINGTATGGNAFVTISDFTLPAGTYTLSSTIPCTTTAYLQLIELTSGSPVILNLYNKSSDTFTINGTKNCRLYFRVANGTALTNFTIYPQIEKGSTATAYEPYGNGLWYIYKEISKVVLNGSENWEDRPAFSDCDRFVLNYTLRNTNFNGFSNYFVIDNGVNISSTYPRLRFNNTQIVVNFSAKGTTTLAQFKEWLSTHNTIGYYVLANATYIKITDTNLSNELEQIYSEAKSYAGRTQVTAGIIGDSAPMVLETTVLKEMN